ncbi:MAG: hypothetical protein WC389_22220, partial [Lutibacter sp.]
MLNQIKWSVYLRQHQLFLVGAAIYIYAIVAMVIFQYILLPRFDPFIKEGLIAGDPQYYHQLASNLAHRIAIEGWGIWNLRPDGQGCAGITAMIYAIAFVSPLLVILLNAFLHSIASVTLISIVGQFVRFRLAVIACLFFIISPYQMHWLSQINKDSYSIAGFYVFVLGWTLVFKQAPKTKKSSYWFGLLLVMIGAMLISIVRPYIIQILQAVSIIIVCVMTIILLSRIITDRLILLSSAIRWLVPVILVTLFLSTMTQMTCGSGEHLMRLENSVVLLQPTKTGESITPSQWTKTRWLPILIDKKLYAIMARRAIYNSLESADNHHT